MSLKVVVVVNEGTEFHKEVFEGENLAVDITSNLSERPRILRVKNGDSVLAEFLEWAYWRKTE